uniref:FAS1 domain-containing protein n=1 Tax=Oryza barthii TaxID=65489 RepID=A0A0D3GMJ7_9ORYZ
MGAPALLLLPFLLLLLAAAAAAAPPEQPALSNNSSGGGAPSSGVNSNSVLVALLDSHYTELAELVEKALLLQTLEDAVGKGNVTIFAPRNEALERDLDPEFRRFLLEPRNLRSLQRLLLFHVLPARLHASDSSSPDFPSSHPTLSGEQVDLSASPMRVGAAAVTRPDAVTEESMYNAVRRFGKVRYDTLRLPNKVTAREADGSVKFGHGEGSAYLFDPDIYTDGRISVQGIDAVLFPPKDTATGGEGSGSGSSGAAPARKAPAVTAHSKSKLRRGKLLEGACQVMGFLGRRSRFASCQ